MTDAVTPIPGKTVLVVDDNDAILQAITDILTRASYTVIRAVNTHQALAAIREYRVDVVLTDVFMSDGDGLELLMELRRERHQMPIIVMSGGGEVVQGDYLQVARDFGASAILKKPFTAKKLLETIAKLG